MDYDNPYWDFYDSRIDLIDLSKALNTMDLFYEGKVIQTIDEIDGNIYNLIYLLKNIITESSPKYEFYALMNKIT